MELQKFGRRRLKIITFTVCSHFTVFAISGTAFTFSAFTLYFKYQTGKIILNLLFAAFFLDN